MYVLLEEVEKVKDDHSRWMPKVLKSAVPGKNAFYFDPYKYTFLSRKSKYFIDGYE